MTEYDGFRVEVADGVATITLDVPGKLNRVSMPAREQRVNLRLTQRLGADVMRTAG